MHVRRLTYVRKVNRSLELSYGHVVDVFVGCIKDPTAFRPVATINSLKVNNLGGSGGQHKAENYPARRGGKRVTLIVSDGLLKRSPDAGHGNRKKKVG